jgi:hypothetical protein
MLNRVALHDEYHLMSVIETDRLAGSMLSRIQLLQCNSWRGADV